MSEALRQFLDYRPVGVREALQLAETILRIHKSDPSDTPIERLARFVLHALRPDVTEEHCGQISMVSTGNPDGVAALRCGELVGLSPGQDVVGSTARARELATALLICAELAESSQEVAA